MNCSVEEEEDEDEIIWTFDDLSENTNDTHCYIGIFNGTDGSTDPCASDVTGGIYLVHPYAVANHPGTHLTDKCGQISVDYFHENTTAHDPYLHAVEHKLDLGAVATYHASLNCTNFYETGSRLWTQNDLTSSNIDGDEENCYVGLYVVC